MSAPDDDTPGRRSAPKPGLRSRGMFGAPAVATVRPGEAAGQGGDRPGEKRALRAKGSVQPSPTVSPLVPDRRGDG